VLPVPHPPTGSLRLAREADLELVAGWIAAFSTEATSETVNAADIAANRIGRAMVFLWEDPEPVSMAAWSGKTPNGVRVNLVYTPPPRRGRGYASACVIGVTRLLLERGNRFCFLFTDLSNPTSNRIYRQLGYRPVCDATDYDFAG
jgi:predicted GNAT family acetyltransferase